MSTKRIGNIGEAKTLYEFVKHKIPVYIPYGDNEKADLIAEFNDKLNKIQIKTAEKCEDGYYIVDLRSCKNHKTTPEVYKYTANDIDYFSVVCVERDVMCLVPISDVEGATSITIRYAESKNKQHKNIRNEADYTIDKFIK